MDYTLRVYTGAVAPDPDTSLASWTTVATITGRSGANGSGGTLDGSFDFSPGTFTALNGSATTSSVENTNPQARYLLLHGTKSDWSGMSPWEIDVFASASEAAPVPEPATMCALGLAVAGLGGYVRRRRKA